MNNIMDIAGYGPIDGKTTILYVVILMMDLFVKENA